MRNYRQFVREFLPANKTIARLTLEHHLAATLEGYDAGAILDVGAKDQPYHAQLECTDYYSLDIIPQPGVDIVGDIHNLDWAGSFFDTILATEVLEHLHTPSQAISEMLRLLRPGGLCIVSTRFFHPYHPDPEDYFRFTSKGLQHLFSNFSHVEVQPLGNKFHSLWLLLSFQPGFGRFFRRLSPLVASISSHSDEVAPCGFLVLARK